MSSRRVPRVVSQPPRREPRPRRRSPAPVNPPPANPPPVKPPPVKVPPRLYRIVGCVSTGAGAVRGGPPRREVAIGFDDGPWTETTAVRQDAREGESAGDLLHDRPPADGVLASDPAARAARRGRARGSHLESPRPDAKLGSAQPAAADDRGDPRPDGLHALHLPPALRFHDTSVQQTARSLGLATVLWNVDPTDWADPGTAAIEQRVLAQVRPGSIIISHDGGGSRSQTLAAYPQIIATLRSRGYRIVTILDLLGFRPVYVPCITPL